LHPFLSHSLCSHTLLLSLSILFSPSSFFSLSLPLLLTYVSIATFNVWIPSPFKQVYCACLSHLSSLPHTLTHTHTHNHTHKHTRTNTHTNAQTHTQTHTHKPTHKHTHINKHTQTHRCETAMLHSEREKTNMSGDWKPGASHRCCVCTTLT